MKESERNSRGGKGNREERKGGEKIKETEKGKEKKWRKRRACMTAGLEPTTFYSTAHYLPPHGTIACTAHQLQILTLMT